MGEARFIACDWGTSNLRLYLCQPANDSSPVVLASKSGPGVADAAGQFEEIFFDLVDEWLRDDAELPIIISGMVGSNIGWVEAPYLPCPADAGMIAGSVTVFESRGKALAIVAGLRTQNPLGVTDFLRGEETQLLGWMTDASAHDAPRLAVLPGTHNKWALLRGGRIESFLTAVTGELFYLLANHSVLVKTPAETPPLDRAAFSAGLDTVESLHGAELVHALFSARSRQISSCYSEPEAWSYLSGMVIGSDVAGALRLFSKRYSNLEDVVVIGDDRIAACYRMALDRHDIRHSAYDSTLATLRGHEAVYRRRNELAR